MRGDPCLAASCCFQQRRCKFALAMLLDASVGSSLCSVNILACPHHKEDRGVVSRRRILSQFVTGPRPLDMETQAPAFLMQAHALAVETTPGAVVHAIAPLEIPGGGTLLDILSRARRSDSVALTCRTCERAELRRSCCAATDVLTT
jgi:hypothetical protein